MKMTMVNSGLKGLKAVFLKLSFGLIGKLNYINVMVKIDMAISII